MEMQAKVKKEMPGAILKNCGTSQMPMSMILDRPLYTQCCELNKYRNPSKPSYTNSREYNDKSLNCDICGRRFPHNSGLKRHLAVHTGERPFVCVTCGKGFKAKAALKRHEIIHTGEFPFECSTCKKRFNQINNLRKHLVIHSNTCPFYCETCGKGFNQLSNLKKHMAVHNSQQKCGRHLPPGRKKSINSNNKLMSSNKSKFKGEGNNRAMITFLKPCPLPQTVKMA